MSSGRTYWWAKDAAWWRRERIIALGEEFAAAGPAVIDWLCCEAKAQNDKGWVKAGYRAVAHGAFVEPVTVGHIVSRAVELGLLDDFNEADGIFTCRISGWNSDQVRVEATLRKRAERARKTSDDGDPVVEPGANGHAGSRDVTARPEPSGESPTGQERTEVETSSLVEPAGPPKKVDREVSRLSHLLADLICERDPKARSRVKPDSRGWLTAIRLLIKDRDGDVDEVERVLRWSQADPFWQTNVLCPATLRRQFVQLAQKSKAPVNGQRPTDPARDARRARGASALQAMLAGQGDDT